MTGSTRSTVCLSKEDSPASAWNCFGLPARDSGHRRVPAPPATKIAFNPSPISPNVPPCRMPSFEPLLRTDDADALPLARNVDSLRAAGQVSRQPLVVAPCLRHLRVERE